MGSDGRCFNSEFWEIARSPAFSRNLQIKGSIKLNRDRINAELRTYLCIFGENFQWKTVR
jgi:hypothetical protein